MTAHRHPVIGLIGKKRSGKDTVASTLVGEFGYTRIAFADPLKEAALGVNPIVDVDLGAPIYLVDLVEREGWEAAKEVGGVREFLQNLGVAIRALDEDFWLNIALDRAEDVDGPVVFTDARFPNEAEAVVDLDGFVVRVVRSSVTSTDTHTSETALDDYPEDMTIANDGTLAELASSARVAHLFADPNLI